MEYIARALDLCSTSNQRQILSFYNETHRYYHNLNHLDSMIKIACEDYSGLTALLFDEKATDDDVDVDVDINLNTVERVVARNLLEIILIHDIVYYPQSSRNEELSKAVYDNLEFNEENKLFRIKSTAVGRAVLASAKHPITLAPREKFIRQLDYDFLDYDLYELSTEKFGINGDNIWYEFHVSTGIPAAQFCMGRKAFFEHMLTTPMIYTRHPQWEDAARDNIKRSLEDLKQPGYAKHLTKLAQKKGIAR